METWYARALCASVMAAALAFSFATPAQNVAVPNPSLESGQAGPEGWSLSGGAGRWLDSGADGARSIAVTGDGQESNAWYSPPLAFQPSGVYILRFQARSFEASGGTAVSGPEFCNRDLGVLSDEWKPFETVFVAPAAPQAVGARLRFGQWQMRGEIAFDAIEVLCAQPVYAHKEGIALGQGEAIHGNAYTFLAPYESVSRNQSRPLVVYQCAYNTNRWSLGTDGEVVYRHAIAGRAQERADINVGVCYYQGGALAIEVSRDGQAWREIASCGEQGGACAVPADLLPASELWVRLKGKAKSAPDGSSQPAAIQVGSYAYSAAISGPPLDMQGATQFVAVAQQDPRFEVTIESVGEALPGGDNVLVLHTSNNGAEIAVNGEVRIEPEGGAGAPAKAGSFRIAPGEGEVRIPYALAQAGKSVARLALGDFSAQARFEVPQLHNASYGELLPPSTNGVAVWWAHSGWKISERRPAPAQRGECLLIRAARNETDAAQLVVRPREGLKGLAIEAGALIGPGGASLPATAIELLRVRYVPITQPTDSVGAVANWPDPLPPFAGSVEVAAGTNQPVWVRVHVPRDTPAGVYVGTIRLRAEGFAAEVPLHVEVYDFALPDRMTCTSAFGFDPALVFQYQKISDPAQQREVLEKYYADYSAHHISVYNPAPLDPFRVKWEGLSPWSGGARDRAERHGGATSLFVCDDKPGDNISAAYEHAIAIPAQGLRLRFWYKTATPGQPALVTLAHLDATGQWMSGRNNDMPFTGDGTWQLFDRPITSFPEGATQVRLTLWATLWREDGSTTGATWYDDVSLQEVATGKESLSEGDFEGTTEMPRPVFDWSAWDAAMAHQIDTYHITAFSVPVPGMGGGSFHSRYEPNLLGFAESTPEYQAAFRGYCQALEGHLREKGWLDMAYVYWFDEPDVKDYAFVMNGFRKLKENCPGIGRMLTEQIEPELIGGPNIWCPLTPGYSHEAAEERRKAGDKFWWYVCTGPKEPYCTLFIDHPATELRVWLWQTWQRKIDGILVWHTNYWTSPTAYPNSVQNPYADPMSWVVGYGTPAGARQPWGNGDGRFVYPPQTAAEGAPAEAVIAGPVDSIRWEMLRDGIEDYEYLAMLRRLLDQKGGSLAESARAQYAALLEIPPAITEDVTSFTTDPAPIEQRRHEIAQAIAALEKQ